LPAQADGFGAGPGPYDEVVLKDSVLRTVAVHRQIDAGEDVPVLDPPVLRDIGVPLRRVGADEVVAARLQLVAANRVGLGVCAHHAEAEDGGAWAGGQSLPPRRRVAAARAERAAVRPLPRLALGLGGGPAYAEDHGIIGQPETKACSPRLEADLRVG